MSGAVSQIDSFTSSSSPLPSIFLLPHESFRSSCSSLSYNSPSASQNNNDAEGEGVVQKGEEEIASNASEKTWNTNPWKKLHGSHNNNRHVTEVMGTSWPALSQSPQNPFSLPHEISTQALEKESGIKDIQTLSVRSSSDQIVTVRKDKEFEKIVTNSVVPPCATGTSSPLLQDQVQGLATEMKNVTEESSENASKDGEFSLKRHENVSDKEFSSKNHDKPLKTIKTLSVSIGSGDEEKQNGSDSSRTMPHPSMQQRPFSNRSKHKPRTNQNQSNYTGFQNHKTSNRHQQPRSYNDRNSGWKHNNTQPVNSQNHLPGYINGPNGFPGQHQPPSSPYAYSHFTPITTTPPPPPANISFMPIPYSVHPQSRYPGYMMPMGYYEFPYISGGGGGAPVHPQISEINDLQGQDANLLYAIRRQIEYYFSEENLATDFYLRNRMDAYGWVSVDLIAAFNKVKRMTKDLDLILRALQPSQIVEIQGNNIRKRINWKTWILPNSLLNKIQNIQLDSKSDLSAGVHQSSSSSSSS